MRALGPIGEAERHEQDDETEDSKEFSHAELKRPANPMKAIERLPAMMRTRAMPFASDGTSAISVASRIEAISTRASVRPNPPPMAKKSDRLNPYERALVHHSSPQVLR